MRMTPLIWIICASIFSTPFLWSGTDIQLVVGKQWPILALVFYPLTHCSKDHTILPLPHTHHPPFVHPFLLKRDLLNFKGREETNAPSLYLNPGGTSFVICPQNGCSLAIDKCSSEHLWFTKACRNIPHFLCTGFISVSTWNKKDGGLRGLDRTWWPS